MKRYLIALTLSVSSLFALEPQDQKSIEEVVHGYVCAWNEHEGVGFGNGFTEDADFVNIIGLTFKGRAEIEDRHIKILRGFLKGSTFKVLKMDVREVQPNVVIAHVSWQVDGFRNPGSDATSPGITQDGIFTHVFIKHGEKWEIIASQNTLIQR